VSALSRLQVRVRRFAGTGVLVLVVSGLVGCSSTTEPRAVPTLLVANASCDSGSCRTLYLSAFVYKWRVPQPPAGCMYLGTSRSRLTCVAFPASQTLTVRGSNDTVYVTWTPSDTLYVSAWDSAADAAGGSTRDSWVGKSADFAPGEAGGWSVVFPSGKGLPPPVASVSSTSRCTP
jgi:hypothetical protein